jgi:hypothetical protein
MIASGGIVDNENDRTLAVDADDEYWSIKYH